MEKKANQRQLPRSPTQQFEMNKEISNKQKLDVAVREAVNLPRWV